MSFDIIMIKSFSASSGSHQEVENPKTKEYVSTSGKPLSEESIKKAKDLSSTIQAKGPFKGIYGADSTTSLQTAIYATGGTEDAHNAQVNAGFNQIHLGIFEKSEAGAIQEAYEKAHPTAYFIPEPNDCLNKPWPGYDARAFETYEEVDERVLKAFANLNLKESGDNPVFVVAATKEPVRSLMLHSSIADSARSSQFYQDLTVHLQREPKIDQPLVELVVRGQLNPKDGSWIRFHYENGKRSIVDVSADVEFRQKPPVPGYIRK